MYEIGFVQFYDGSAKEIITFADRKSANDEAGKRNKELGIDIPGRGQWGWMVAYKGEIPRKLGCIVNLNTCSITL